MLTLSVDGLGSIPVTGRRRTPHLTHFYLRIHGVGLNYGKEYRIAHTTTFVTPAAEHSLERLYY